MAEAVSSDYGSSSKGRPSIELDVDSVNKSKDSLQQDCSVSQPR